MANLMIVTFALLISAMPALLPAAVAEPGYITHLTNANVQGFEGIDVQVTTTHVDSKLVITFILLSTPSGITNTPLGIDKFLYDNGTSVLSVSDPGCDSGSTPLNGWGVNSGSTQADGFGNFASMANSCPGGTGGVSSPIAFTLDGDPTIPANANNAKYVVHVRFSSSTTCSAWVSDGTSTNITPLSETGCTSKANPSFTTSSTPSSITLSSSQTPSVTDTATLSGGNNPGGSITFEVFFTNVTCPGSQTPLFTSTVPVSGNGQYTSDPFTPIGAGDYAWVVSYSGDANNNPFGPTSCGETGETFTVNKASPSISSALSAPKINVGDSAHDSASLSNAFNPTGTVSYTVFTDPGCTSKFADAGTNLALVGGVVPDSDSVTFNQAGTFYWQVVYSGDSNNNGATSTCTDETLVVSGVPSLQITKSADAATLPAGQPIGFTITLTNTGSEAAAGVSISDSLPSGSGVNWSIDSNSPECSILGSPPSQTLSCTVPSLAGNGGSFSVHVTSSTNQDSCKLYDNTATVTSSNAGSGQSSASITVQCGTIIIVKNTVGGDDKFTFTGTGTGGFPATFDIQTTGLTGQKSFSVEPGSYTVSEALPLPDDFEQVTAVCDSGTPPSFTVPAGGTVKCTFTNQKPVPEYPFGLALLFMAVAGIYALVRRRVVQW